MPWRAMTERDLAAVNRISDAVHVRYWESDAVVAERLALYPAGCHVLAPEGAVMGYVTSHPWRALDPPALDTMLGAIPEAAATYYIHDMALLPAARSRGWGGVMVRRLIAHAIACGLPDLSLIAVNRSTPFWTSHGFRVREEPALAAKLASYDAAARYMTLAAALRPRRMPP